MCGQFHDQGGLFSYLSPEARLPPRHPLPQIRELVRTVLKEFSVIFGKSYSSEGRPSIPPEQMLSALLLQVFYGACWINRAITAGWSSAACRLKHSRSDHPCSHPHTPATGGGASGRSRAKGVKQPIYARL
jgi:hypothetical protein